METRIANKEDIAELKRIHAESGMDYKFPDLERSENDLVMVIEHEGRIVGGALGRVIAETYLWVDPAMNRHDKWTAIRLLQTRGIEEAQKRGWAELIAGIPECVEKLFARRLKLLRWGRSRAGWHYWGLPISREGDS